MTGRKIAGRAPETWLRWAAVLALTGLGMIVWSIVDPAPIPVIVSMSIGQGVGTLSLLLFLFVVIADLRGSAAPPAAPEATPPAATPPAATPPAATPPAATPPGEKAA